MDDWEPLPYEPWETDDEPGPDVARDAFAAYEEAWAERDRTGLVTSELLVAALRRRRVPVAAYAEGTRLRSALFGSWERARRPRRMHGVIVRYRLGRLLDVRGLGDDTPEHMRLPPELVPAHKWGPVEDASLPFTPSGTFGARVKHWYAAVDDGARERPVPVWLDTGPDPGRTAVMVGRELAGHTELPAPIHHLLAGAARRGRRVVVTGDLWVKRRKGDTWRADVMSVELPAAGNEERRQSM
jgi:hypothetical protein